MARHNLQKITMLVLVLLLLPCGTKICAQESEAKSIPMKIDSGTPLSPYPLWIKAEALLNSDRTAVDSKVLQTLHSSAVRAIQEILDTDQKGQDCVRLEIAWIDYFETKPRETLEDAMYYSDLIVTGTVVAQASGFLVNVAGTLLQINALKFAKGWSERTNFFLFIPIGEFSLGAKRICKVDARYAGLPKIGDEVVVFTTDPWDDVPIYLPLQDLVWIQGKIVKYPPQFLRNRDEKSPPLPANKASLLERLGNTVDGLDEG
jgi:hypothetical protein